MTRLGVTTQRQAEDDNMLEQSNVAPTDLSRAFYAD